MGKDVPILLSFYGLSNGAESLFTGQLTYSSLRDFSFRDYSSHKTFRTIMALYRTRFFSNQPVTLRFNEGETIATTDASGSFFCTANASSSQTVLESVIMNNGVGVRILEDLYTRKIHFVNAPVIVVSDIDDTLLHSNVSDKLLKFRTLMFTAVENRKAILSMKNLIGELHEGGAAAFYLSNSEQNLYPLIYRFLLHNGFPAGPLFLKQMRKMRDIFRPIRLEDREKHKTTILNEILRLFPDKNFILLGDNTQLDLKIYLQIADQHPGKIRHIIIRKVLGQSHSKFYLNETAERLKAKGIGFHYGDSFPAKFELD